jgi:hypothetical protein
VVSDHSDGDVGSWFLSIWNSADRFDLLKDRSEEIGLVITFHTLKDGRNPFQAHPGIDAGFGQRLKSSLWISIELHKNEIPEF